MPKPFYKVRNVQYSTDINFFLQHQIMVIHTLNHELVYDSNLEKYTFKREHGVRTRPAADITRQTSEQIHRDLLEGKYGDGFFTD